MDKEIKYKIVPWPNTHNLQDHKWFEKECCLVMDENLREKHGEAAYFVPIHRLQELGLDRDPMLSFPIERLHIDGQNASHSLYKICETLTSTPEKAQDLYVDLCHKDIAFLIEFITINSPSKQPF